MKIGTFLNFWKIHMRSGMIKNDPNGFVLSPGFQKYILGHVYITKDHQDAPNHQNIQFWKILDLLEDPYEVRNG